MTKMTLLHDRQSHFDDPSHSRRPQVRILASCCRKRRFLLSRLGATHKAVGVSRPWSAVNEIQVFGRSLEASYRVPIPTYLVGYVYFGLQPPALTHSVSRLIVSV